MGEIKKVLKAIFKRFACPKCGEWDTQGSYPEMWMCHNRKCRAMGQTKGK
jgi:ribosomal protein L37AE/L43A